MKECTIAGCSNPVFTHGYCKYHAGLYYSKQPKKHKEPTKSARSDYQYHKACKEINKEAKEGEGWRCFVCGKPFAPDEHPDHHHLRGRTGNLKTDKDYLILVHRSCHQALHDIPISELRLKSWWPFFMKRLKEKDPQTYLRYEEPE